MFYMTISPFSSIRQKKIIKNQKPFLEVVKTLKDLHTFKDGVQKYTF